MTNPQLRTIGLLGGMSPESTADYYQRINRAIRARLGGYHGAKLVLYSVNLQEVLPWMDHDADALAEHLCDAARKLEQAGADFIIMACNTAHMVASQIERAISLPFVHIADVLGQNLKVAGHLKLGLLAARITAEAPFFRERLARFGVKVVPTTGEAMNTVDRIIRQELVFHEIRSESRAELEQIAGSLKAAGAHAIALACTELGLLVEGDMLGGLPVFDTAVLHCAHAAQLALPS